MSVGQAIQAAVKCKRCNNVISRHARHCSVCGQDVGFPNVRACETADEKSELSRRYKAAKRAAREKGGIAVLNDLECQVAKSKAVISRPLSVVITLLADDNAMYVSFYKNVQSGARIPEDNIWDNSREAGDCLLFPHYHQNIIFAALTLNNRGVNGYGDFNLILKSLMIELRASVFEMNSFEFVKTRRLAAGSAIPPGFRATWEDRARLAVAKLGKQVTVATSSSGIPKLLIDTTGERDGSFVEAHVYGAIDARAIERVVAGKRTLKKSERLLVDQFKKRMKNLGVAFEDEK
jgi:hypothetical protein